MLTCEPLAAITARRILAKIHELQEAKMLRDHARCVKRRKDMRLTNRCRADALDLRLRASGGEEIKPTGGDEDGMSM